MHLLITGAWRSAPDKLKEIEQLGHKVLFLQNEKDKLPCSYADIEGVICNGLFLYHPIEEFTSLKYIQLTSAGYDRVDMDYVRRRGIIINNAHGVYSIPMAEFAVLGVLQLYKKSRFFYENQKSRKWGKSRELLELNGKTVCVIGAGNVGTECAKRFKAFGTEVLGVDLFPRKDEHFDAIYELRELDEVLKISDIVILTLPLTEQTKHLINSDRLKVMKHDSVLVNIARGQLIEENALVDALKNKLLGAVLDVFEEEPLSETSVFWELNNVIISPHNSFVSERNENRLFDVILDGIRSCRERL